MITLNVNARHKTREHKRKTVLFGKVKDKVTDIETKHKKIYERLQDDESRELFKCRYMYWKEKDIAHLWDELRIANQYNKMRDNNYNGTEQDVLNLLDDENLRNSGVIIYGAGANAAHCISLFHWRKAKILSVVDSDPQKHGSVTAGYQIAAPNVVGELFGSAIVVTPKNKHQKEEIRNTLLESGVSNDCIFYFDFHQERQYFGPSFMFPQQDEVYIDGGCYDGLTILEFLEFAGHGKIYGFEPDPDCYINTLKFLEKSNIDNVQLIQKGLYDYTGSLRFDRTWVKAAGSRIDEKGRDTIETTRIDDVVHEKVTFIKMDVEGSELKALHGAKNSIKKHMPRLAICIYHKPEDIVEIPEYILSLHNGYRFYIRHHVPWLNNETVLYAVL